MTEAEFWASTPYLTRLVLEAAGERESLANRRELYGAWHAAGFARIKRMPRLDRVLRGNAKPKPMSEDHMLRMAEGFVRKVGGADLRTMEAKGNG